MKKYILYPLVLLLAVSSCNKTKVLPEPEITEPHFYMSCEMDGKPLSIKAGNEDYYMNSSWYHQDSASIYVYKGNLAKQTGTGYQLTVLINDYQNAPVSAFMSPDSTLRPGEHLFYDQNSSGLTQKVIFTPVKAEEASATYSWELTDGVTTKHYDGKQNNWYSIAPVLKSGKNYSVTLSYNDGTGTCAEQHTNVFRAGSGLQTTVTAEKLGGGELIYRLSYTNYSNMYSACQWMLPDQSVISAPTFTKIFSPGTSLIKLMLSDKSSGDSCISYYQLNASYGNPCDANYTAKFLPVQNSRLYSSIIVLLTDPEGRVYSSQNLVQPQTSSFEILSVENYGTNDKGEATKRLKVKFDCLVKNGGQEIKLSNGEAAIAIAYKR